MEDNQEKLNNMHHQRMREEYIDNGMRRIMRHHNILFENIESVRQGLDQCYDHTFSLDDAVKWSRCTEEVNPELDEDKALKRMAAISAPYPKGKTAKKEKKT